eukprot:m.27923 g.27923  ORF g.27923 m.27923 type:complete len:333 (-) comp14034_c0_seq1:49-1047(-)
MPSEPPKKNILQGDGSLNKLFASIEVSYFTKPSKGIITVPSDLSISDAVSVLAKHDILSCPVRDVAQPDDAGWRDKYLGFVDMGGALWAMLEELAKLETLEEFSQQLRVNASLSTTKVGNIADSGLSRFGPFVAVDDSSNLLDILLLLGRYGLRRIPVVKIGGDLENIITQSAVVAALARSTDEFEMFSKTLAELKLSEPVEVLSVKDEQTPLDAFKLLRDKEIGGCPVLNSDGKIVSSVDVKMARYLVTHPEAFKLMNKPFSTFGDNLISAAVVTAEASLADVIKTLHETHLHRCFVVDADCKPLRTLSLRDIICLLVQEPQGYFGSYFDL